MPAAVPVLLRSRTDRQLWNTSTDPNQTAADLKAQVAELAGVPPGCIAQVSFHGEELADDQQLSGAGISSTCRPTIQGVGSQLFPNNWFDSPYATTYTKVLDITWPPLRQADYSINLGWVAALLALLAAANSVLG